MKISRLFHYLYACMMFLPLLVIPIFAINIINRSPEPISVTVDDTETTYEVVEHYKYSTNEVVYNNGVIDQSTFIEGNIYYLNIVNAPTSYQVIAENVPSNTFLINGISCPNVDGDSCRFRVTNNKSTFSFNTTYIFSFPYDDRPYYFVCYDKSYLHANFYNDFTLSKYTGTYNVIEYSEIVSVTTGTTTTYNDTDIGSQFVYSVYSVTDKYFNVTDLFGFDAMQQWFIVNIFHGSVNLGFYIFWNLLTYWLFASIFWLIFDVVIYVPQLVHRWLDKGVIE